MLNQTQAFGKLSPFVKRFDKKRIRLRLSNIAIGMNTAATTPRPVHTREYDVIKSNIFESIVKLQAKCDFNNLPLAIGLIHSDAKHMVRGARKYNKPNEEIHHVDTAVINTFM